MKVIGIACSFFNQARTTILPSFLTMLGAQRFLWVVSIFLLSIGVVSENQLIGAFQQNTAESTFLEAGIEIPKARFSRKSKASRIQIGQEKCIVKAFPEGKGKLLNRISIPMKQALLHWQEVQSQGVVNMPDVLLDLLNINAKEKGDFFNFLQDFFVDLCRAGIFSQILMQKSDPSVRYRTTFGKTKSIHMRTVAQGLYRDFTTGEDFNATCVERMAWPLTWHVSNDSTFRDPTLLPIRAFPLRKDRDGSFTLLKNESWTEWSLLRKSNIEFFKQNGFVVRSTEEEQGTDSGLIGKSQNFYYELPNTLYQCIRNQIHLCMNRGDRGDKHFCSEWDIECGMQNIVKARESRKGTVATHVLYTVGRSAGWGVSNVTKPSLDERQRLKQIQRNSQLHRISLAMVANAETSGLAAILRSSREYLPALPQEQDLLTYFIIVASWGAEWLISAPLWALKVWWIILRGAKARSASRTNGFYISCNEDFETLSRAKKQILLILPAVVGVIPIPVGFLFAMRLQKRSAGILSCGFSSQKYEGFFDPSQQDAKINSAATLAYAVTYSEDSQFNNLLIPYLVATCVATSLLLFSIAPLLILGVESFSVRACCSWIMSTEANRKQSAEKGDSEDP